MPPRVEKGRLRCRWDSVNRCPVENGLGQLQFKSNECLFRKFPVNRLTLSPMLTISSTDRLFILAGAGVSAESRIPTFRGMGGLWRSYRVEEVASPFAWHRDPRLVWDFYSQRRRVAFAAQPKPAHFTLPQLARASCV